ncbi:hypothetical protein PQO01_11950 [Lentisphaera marina]|uniref:hypothetical protein n=1 Tax=Lentisphaera marina TaxID=1111041 RepID=UPI0023663866|nr:hypothetical protein [Lentisphaera marina]MDD7985663.1 hypothetical protein [Lentisphaera marina]
MYVNSETFSRKHILPVIEEKTQFTIEADSIELSLLKGKISLKGINAYSGPNTIKAAEFTVSVDIFACLKENYKVHNITLNSAKINLAYDATGKLKSDPTKIKTLKLEKVSKKKTSTNKPKQQPIQELFLKELFSLPQQINKKIKPIDLPSFHLDTLSISESTISIKKDNRYGKSALQEFDIESFAINNLGPAQNFDISLNGSYLHEDINKQKFECKNIKLLSSGNFNPELTNASTESKLSISEISSSKIKNINNLSLEMKVISELKQGVLKLNEIYIVCKDENVRHSELNLNAEVKPTEINTELKIKKLDSSLLNITLSLAPKSKTLTRWLSYNKQAGHKTGFTNTDIKGEFSFKINQEQLLSQGQLNVSNIPMTRSKKKQLLKDEVSANITLDLDASESGLRALNLKLKASDIQGHTFLHLDSNVNKQTINGDLQASKLDLSLFNSFLKKEEELHGQLNSKLTLKQKDESYLGTVFLSSTKLQHAKIPQELNGSLSFAFNNKALKTILTDFNLSIDDKALGKVDLDAKTLSIDSRDKFTENTLTSPLMKIEAKILKSPTQHSFPKQSIIIDLKDFIFTQSQERLASNSQFSIKGTRFKDFNDISSDGAFDFNTDLLGQVHALSMSNVSISNHNKALLKFNSLDIHHQILSDTQKTTVRIPKLNLPDIQEIATLLNNTPPKFKQQALSSEVKIDLSQNSKLNLLNSRIELPSLQLMKMSPLAIATNINHDKNALTIKNFSFVQGPHVLNLNASYSKDLYEISNFNGTLDLAYIDSIIKNLNPNFSNHFEGLATFNNTKFKSSGSTPEEVFTKLENGNIDWQISNLKLDLKKEEKTFISKNLGFKPEDLHFDQGELKMDFSPQQIKLQKLKLMGEKGGCDIHGKIYQKNKQLNSQFFTWASFIGSDYLHLIPPQTILDNINELDDFLDYNKDKKWYEFDDFIELLSSAEDGKFSTLFTKIQFNSESKFGPYIDYLESAKNLSEGKLNKQSAKSVLDIFKQREEERQLEREKQGKKKKDSKTKKVLDLLDGLF